MIVDPATGLAMEESGPAPRSMPGTYGTAVGQNLGLQTPLYYDAMEAIPPATTTVAWNISRVRRTLLNNNVASPRSRNAGGIRQTFSPFRFMSLADVGNIDPDFVPRGASAPVMSTRSPGVISKRRAARRARAAENTLSGMRGATTQAGWAKIAGMVDADYSPRARPGYTPFQFSGVLNSGVGAVSNRFGSGKYGRVLTDNNQRLFAPGAFGTAATGSTLMAGAYTPTQLGNIVSATGRFAGSGADFARFSKTALGGGLGSSARVGTYAAAGLEAARFGDSKITGRAVGYYRGAQAQRLGTRTVARQATRTMGMAGSFYDEGLQAGASAFARNRIGARIAGSAATSVGLRAAGPVGTVLLVGDIARFGGKMVGRGVRLGLDALKSAEGDLSKPGPFGMGYTDNSVAATSRQRGVMAIANSRMNARSALGQEAAYLHASFG